MLTEAEEQAAVEEVEAAVGGDSALIRYIGSDKFINVFNMRKKILISIIICESAAIIGSFFTAPAITSWYRQLEKPLINPPNWVFGPVWTILYFLMGFSLALVWREGSQGQKIKNAIFIFGIQLAFNIFWSFLFFKLRSPFYALWGIIILWVLILLTIIKFYKISKKAAFLLLPYLLWVSFAVFLNFEIWRLNR